MVEPVTGVELPPVESPPEESQEIPVIMIQSTAVNSVTGTRNNLISMNASFLWKTRKV